MAYQLLYFAYGSKEETNTGWMFLNKYIKQKKRKNKVIKQRIKLYKLVAYDNQVKE